MTLKGDYNASAEYAAGDVVRFQDAGFVAKESTQGNPPTVDSVWRRLDQDLWDVVDMILDVAALNVTDESITLKTDDGEYLISVDDSGDTPELAVEAIVAEEGT